MGCTGAGRQGEPVYSHCLCGVGCCLGEMGVSSWLAEGISCVPSCVQHLHPVWVHLWLCV